MINKKFTGPIPQQEAINCTDSIYESKQWLKLRGQVDGQCFPVIICGKVKLTRYHSNLA